MSKKIYIVLALFIGALIFIESCTRNNIEKVAGSNSCDTTQVSFQRDIQPILDNYCYQCHSNANKAFSNGVSLEGYDNFKGWCQSGYVLGDIRQESGFTPMPYGKPKISDCAINKIVAWINQDFPN
ncbi:MAG: hypothetical protein JST75_15110 [Bacteroidetes bacterium]|nr:hypothetical protein [Bacteroidota bacterium]